MGVDAVKVRMQRMLESLFRCGEQFWTHCGRPSKTFLSPHAVQGGKAALICKYSFEGLGLTSGQLLNFQSNFRHRW